VADLGVPVIGMVRREKADQAKKAIAQQVTPQGRGPVRVTPIKTPGQVGKYPDAGIPQRYDFDFKRCLRNGATNPNK
jgi:hypothetical protein